MRDKIYQILTEIGVNLPENIENDFDLSQYMEDSLIFISSIVKLEDELKIEIPDELLDYNNMTSFYGFCELMDELVNMKIDN